MVYIEVEGLGGDYLEEQIQCPECKSYKVSEAMNYARGTYVGGVCGAFVSLAAGNATFLILSFVLIALGLLAMIGDEQWLGIKRVGIFFIVLAPLLALWLELYVFNSIIISVGILLFIVGYRNQSKTRPKSYECSSCGYKMQENQLKDQSKTVSL